MKNVALALSAMAFAASVHAGEKYDTESVNGIDQNGYGNFKLVDKPECKLMAQVTDSAIVARHLVCGEVGLKSTYQEVNVRAPRKEIKAGDKIRFE